MNNIGDFLTPALTAYLIGLIYRNTRTSCTALARLCAPISHDALQRGLYARLPWSRRLWDGFASKLVAEGGYLILDDTTWRRFAKCAAAVGYVWSATAGKTILGMQVVLLIWTDGRRKVPLGIRIWRKGGPSKVELAAGLLREAKRRGLQPQYVLFDSWYTAASLLNVLDEWGWKYVARLRSNRLLEGRAVREHWPHRFGHKHGRLRRLTHDVLVVKDGRRYFVSNDLALCPRQVKAHYGHRQQIEEVFRLLKQEFGWGSASARSLQAQNAHLHLGLYALYMTQAAALCQGQTIYAYKQTLFRQPIPTELQLYDDFRKAA